MDVLYFLKRRTRLIRRYYDLAAQPFSEIMRSIEAETADAILCPNESGPPCLGEWLEAQEMLDLTGRYCVSMLSTSLKLYFMTWKRQLRMTCEKTHAEIFKRDGWVAGYRACFAERLGIDWSHCPADLAIIEQVVLARNRDQHPDHITTPRMTHTEHDLKRHPRPFFISDREAALLDDGDDSRVWMALGVHISQDKLMIAIDNVETLCEWLEDKMFDAKYRRRQDRARPVVDGAQPISPARTRSEY